MAAAGVQQADAAKPVAELDQILTQCADSNPDRADRP